MKKIILKSLTALFVALMTLQLTPVQPNNIQIVEAKKKKKSKKVTAYYTAYGEKYHKRRSCRTLRRSKKVYKTKIKTPSKSHRCKVCWR